MTISAEFIKEIRAQLGEPVGVHQRDLLAALKAQSGRIVIDRRSIIRQSDKSLSHTRGAGTGRDLQKEHCGFAHSKSGSNRDQHDGRGDQGFKNVFHDNLLVNTISDPELISKKKSECRACVESFSPNDIRKR